MVKVSDLARPWSDSEKALFPRVNDPAPPAVFELGLVLGGTVSSGAYTAGVLDFLIEALDAWTQELKDKPHTTPSWAVRVKAVSGSSGGGVLAAIFSRALAYRFPAVREADSPQVGQANPFYNVWVDSLDITPMLDTGDIVKGQPLRSLLNASCLEETGRYVATFTGQAIPQRDYVAEPLPIFLTLTSLRGLPCAVSFPGGKGQNYMTFAEYVKFYVYTQNAHGKAVPADGFGVSNLPGPNGFVGWSTVAQYALGTAAFPIGFPSRDVSLPVAHMRLRPMIVVKPGNFQVHYAGSTYEAVVDVLPRPINWSVLAVNGGNEVPEDYSFPTVDGGALDNEPIEICRRQLAGMIGRNDRDGTSAQRAVILIDPFFDSPDLQSASMPDVFGEIIRLFGTWKGQARYDTQDLQLATDQKCFSRFMITAQRDGEQPGGRSIASASLMAFGGFLSKAFRRHDYFLGRRNCQQFLQSELLIPAVNPVFGANCSGLAKWSSMLVQDSSNRQCLPLIPLYGVCRNKEQVPLFPKGAFNPEANTFERAVAARIAAVLSSLLDSKHQAWPYRWLGRVAIWWKKDDLAKDVQDKIREGLKDWKLL